MCQLPPQRFDITKKWRCRRECGNSVLKRETTTGHNCSLSESPSDECILKLKWKTRRRPFYFFHKVFSREFKELNMGDENFATWKLVGRTRRNGARTIELPPARIHTSLRQGGQVSKWSLQTLLKLPISSKLCPF